MKTRPFFLCRHRPRQPPWCPYQQTDFTLEETMFAESMLETSWGQRTRRSWTTLTSFGLQALVIGLLLLFPLWKTVGLPSGRVLPTPVSWGSPPPAAPPLHHQNTTTIVQSNLADNVLIAPREVPRQVAMIEETSAPPQMSFNTAGVQGGTGSGSGDGVWKSLGDSLNHPASLPVSAAAPTVRALPQLKPARGELGSSSAAGLSFAGEKRASSGNGCSVRHHQQSGHHRKPARSLRASDAGGGGHRGGQPVALSSVHPQQRANRGGDADHGELFVVGKLMQENDESPCCRRE